MLTFEECFNLLLKRLVLFQLFLAYTHVFIKRNAGPVLIYLHLTYLSSNVKATDACAADAVCALASPAPCTCANSPASCR